MSRGTSVSADVGAGSSRCKRHVAINIKGSLCGDTGSSRYLCRRTDRARILTVLLTTGRMRILAECAKVCMRRCLTLCIHIDTIAEVELSISVG